MPARTRTPAEPMPQVPEDSPDAGGYFRNAGATDLTVLGDGFTAVLAPGRIAAFDRTPTHRDLQPASEADFQAQQSADRAAADAAAVPTDETEA